MNILDAIKRKFEQKVKAARAAGHEPTYMQLSKMQRAAEHEVISEVAASAEEVSRILENVADRELAERTALVKEKRRRAYIKFLERRGLPTDGV